MPIHDFQAEDGELVSVYVKIQAPSEEHSKYIRPEDGKIFKRVYSAETHFSKDTRVGDGSREDFERTIGGKNDTLGDVWRRSEELSNLRAAKNGGLDPVKEKFYADYEKKNRAKHADVLKRNRQESIETLHKKWGLKIEF